MGFVPQWKRTVVRACFTLLRCEGSFAVDVLLSSFCIDAWLPEQA
jgi:hypothetical protein